MESRIFLPITLKGHEFIHFQTSDRKKLMLTTGGAGDDLNALIGAKAETWHKK